MGVQHVLGYACPFVLPERMLPPVLSGGGGQKGPGVLGSASTSSTSFLCFPGSVTFHAGALASESLKGEGGASQF